MSGAIKRNIWCVFASAGVRRTCKLRRSCFPEDAGTADSAPRPIANGRSSVG